MAGITVGGIGSGLDINGLVSQLVSAEGAPATNRLNRREAALQAQLTAIGTFKGALSAFQSAVEALTEPTKFQGMKATVGNTDLFTASASSEAETGSYSVEVRKLAQVQKLATSADSAFASTSDTFGKGTVTFEFGSYESGSFVANVDKTPQTLTFDTEVTLEGMRDAINEADFGVKASIVNDGNGYRLVLSGADTGAENALRITVSSDGDGNDADDTGLSRLAFDALGTTASKQTLAAQDAEVVVDGLTVTNAGNTLTEVVQGMTLTLKKSGEATSLDVTQDTATATGAVKAFVDAYNKLVETTQSLTSYNAETREKGALLGDASVRSVTGQLRGILGSTFGDTSAAFRTLSDLGISTERGGTLKLDSSKLQTAIETNAQGVAALFSRGTDDTAPEGIADRLDGLLSSVLESGGTLDSRTTSINNRISALDDQREALSRRLDALETRYRAQFTAMDELVSQLTATSNFLTQQLAGLANIYKKD